MRIKALHKKIIVDSIMNHIIPQVSSLKTPKEMFDSLTNLFEGKNINQNMTLRKQLNNVCQKEVITFSRLWVEHIQEEARLIIIEKKMGETEDQTFTIQRRHLKR